jgi:hypothetical protein
LADQLHYLNASGDKAQDATRYWFDTRANLRREMEERKKRFEEKNEVRGRMAEVLKKLTGSATFFEGSHIFTPHGDVPDDSALRLVVLTPEQFYSREEPRRAVEAALEHVRYHGAAPRYRGNRLIFLAPDHGALTRLRDCIRVALAWNSIVEDVNNMRLVLDNLQTQQAKKDLQGAEDVLPRVARECYKWLLCPTQDNPTSAKPTVEIFPLNTGAASLGPEIERVCTDNVLVITTWSPIHLRDELKKLYWKADKPAFRAMAFWEDTLRYVYLPRLKGRAVLEQAIIKGAASCDFFGTAFGQNGENYEGFKFGDKNVQLDDTLLLIAPEAAQQYQTAHVSSPTLVRGSGGGSPTGFKEPTTGFCETPPQVPSPTAGTPKARTFIGTAEVSAATAKMRLVQIAEEIIGLLASDPQATVNVRVEINADFPGGVSDQIKRAVSENAVSLSFKNKTWE